MNKDNSYFKTCPSCKHNWLTQSEFVADDSLVLNGYMADFKQLERGLFLFTHTVEKCKSTIAIEVKDFQNLYTGPVYKKRQTKLENCPRYCLDQSQLDRCDAKCECAFVREITDMFQEKQGSKKVKGFPP